MTSYYSDPARAKRSTPAGPATALALKRQKDVRISVVLPALNEAGTIGAICQEIRASLMTTPTVVDELIVLDSGSSDATAAIARDAGAVVHRADELTDFGPVLGKGDCLWRSLTVTSGDVVVWLDSDTRNFTHRFVTDLVIALLEDDAIVMSKAFYDRPLVTEQDVSATGGARVTELVARPLLQLFYPELRRMIQPLSGEYAGYTEIFKTTPFLTGYGVEVGILIDIAERFGVERIAQVDLGVRIHRNRSVVDLGAAASQVMAALLCRLDELGRIKIPDPLPDELIQFVSTPDGLREVTRSVEVVERPPVASL